MNLEKLFLITEELRKKTIGDPVYIQHKQVFEYENHSVEVVAVLKLVRAVQSLKAMVVLCDNGLFVDMSAVCRCVFECCWDVHFLLESYPAKSEDVEQFIKAFFETTIDMRLDNLTGSVQIKKIQSASVRILSQYRNEHEISKLLRTMYKTYSGYVHSNYSHIMQIYGGPKDHFKFNLNGIANMHQKTIQSGLVQEAYNATVNAYSFIALKLGVRDLYIESRKLVGEL